jgi:hypothetical protein
VGAADELEGGALLMNFPPNCVAHQVVDKRLGPFFYFWSNPTRFCWGPWIAGNWYELMEFQDKLFDGEDDTEEYEWFIPPLNWHFVAVTP